MVFLESNSKLLECFHSLLPRLTHAETIWVGFSGGLDSTVLLHAMKSLGLPVKALHINHQLSVNASMWQEHCRTISTTLGVPFECASVNVVAEGQGLESAAREARYEIFKQMVGPNDVLCLGHHADDQLETVLFRLVRGTGFKGLSGIPVERCLPLNNGRSTVIVRPLLGIARDELNRFAAAHQLQWVEDESNQQDSFDRNYLRNNVVPLLKSRWPDSVNSLVKTTQLVAETQGLMDDYGREDLARCDLRSERWGQSIALPQLLALSAARRRHVLRLWVEQLGLNSPNVVHLQELEKLIVAKQDAVPMVNWGNCECRRFQNRLYMHLSLPELNEVEPLISCWAGETVALPLGALAIGGERRGENIPLAVGNYSIRFRQGGERCKPSGRAHSQSLKKLLQEYNVEPWLRSYVPIIYCGDVIAAVGDVFVCDGFAVEDGWLLAWCI